MCVCVLTVGMYVCKMSQQIKVGERKGERDQNPRTARLTQRGCLLPTKCQQQDADGQLYVITASGSRDLAAFSGAEP